VAPGRNPEAVTREGDSTAMAELLLAGLVVHFVKVINRLFVCDEVDARTLHGCGPTLTCRQEGHALVEHLRFPVVPDLFSTASSRILSGF
jgi:hypothetical protein